MEIVDEVLTSRAGLQKTSSDHHAAIYKGGEWMVAIEAHRHGAVTTVTVRTDQLRTSRVDMVVRHMLNQLPFQAGDPPREY